MEALAPLPRLPGFDHTLTLLKQGYDFIGNGCRAAGSDGFETRLMLRNVLCLQGAGAAELFYGHNLFSREGALPPTTLRLLQDKGSVQGLVDAAHEARKAMFVRLLMELPPDTMVGLFEREFLSARKEWARKDEIEFFSAINHVLTRAVCAWAGVVLEPDEMQRLCRSLVGMVEHAGKVGPLTMGELLRRNAIESRVRGWIRAVREGRMDVPEDGPLAVIARHRDAAGELLPLKDAAVELINILRPVVAVGRWMLFLALALHDHPEWRMRFALGEDEPMEPFAEEVRRLYPFFPLVAGTARRPFEWRGKRYPAGQWVLLDLYGTNRDPERYAQAELFQPGQAPSWRDQGFDFIPQGGGDARQDHRCPGERLTLALMVSCTRLLTRALDYDVPEQDLTLPLNRMPTRPRKGLRMRVRPLT